MKHLSHFLKKLIFLMGLVVSFSCSNNGTEAFQFEMNNLTLILTYVDEPGIEDDELVLRYNRE